MMVVSEFLSTTPERHAAGHGLYKGITTRPWRTPPEPDNPDVDAESHYYRFFYVVATALQWLAIALAWLAAQGYVDRVLNALL